MRVNTRKLDGQHVRVKYKKEIVRHWEPVDIHGVSAGSWPEVARDVHTKNKSGSVACRKAQSTGRELSGSCRLRRSLSVSYQRSTDG